MPSIDDTTRAGPTRANSTPALSTRSDSTHSDSTRSDSGPPRRPIPPPPTRRSAPRSAESVTDLEPDQRIEEELRSTVLVVRAWNDPLVDEAGHDPRSRYVEQFWLGVLGPTATWLLRRLVAGLERSPDGYEIDLERTAREMGMSYRVGRASPFAKAMQRCTMFGLAHQTSDGIAVRRKVPVVAQRHLRRMPEAVRAAHERWVRTVIEVDELSRAHRLALAMIESGDDISTIEHRLVAIGVSDAVAAEVADNARNL